METTLDTVTRGIWTNCYHPDLPRLIRVNHQRALIIAINFLATTLSRLPLAISRARCLLTTILDIGFPCRVRCSLSQRLTIVIRPIHRAITRYTAQARRCTLVCPRPTPRRRRHKATRRTGRNGDAEICPKPRRLFYGIGYTITRITRTLRRTKRTDWPRRQDSQSTRSAIGSSTLVVAYCSRQTTNRPP